MGYKYNNKFAYRTFEEEAEEFNRPVRCLTFQGDEVYYAIMKSGSYKPDLDKTRKANRGLYESYIKQLGFMPIWVLNPLQFGKEPTGLWDPDWFVDGSLWRKFLETCGMNEEIINNRLLLEIEVPSTALKRDVTLDYGFISVIPEIRKENFVAMYKLLYTDIKHDSKDDWFYPTIYPHRFNDDRATFKCITNFREPE